MAARTYTRAELITRLEQLTDTENDGHITAAEKGEILDSAMAETWDKICSVGLGEKFVKSTTWNTTAGTQAYALQTVCTDSDFYRVHAVYVDEGNGQFRPLQRISSAEVQAFRAPSTVVPIKMFYIPYLAKAAATFDGLNGWEEHVLMTAACAIKMKKEDSYSQFAQRKRELEARMEAMGPADFGEPARVVRKRKRSTEGYFYQNGNVNCYMLRGPNIELLYRYGYQA